MRCGDCSPRPHARTSASSPQPRRMNSCCCGCGPTPSPRSATAGASSGQSCERPSLPSSPGPIFPIGAGGGCDYGAFRCLQRHRLLTIEWQPLSPTYGFEVPLDVEVMGAAADWRQVMSESAELYESMRTSGPEEAAQYALSMAYRIRFYMDVNAREAMHLIELRTTPQGHPVYRRVCQEMYRLIRDEAGHMGIADSMKFVDLSPAETGRLEAERRTDAKRRALSGP